MGLGSIFKRSLSVTQPDDDGITVKLMMPNNGQVIVAPHSTSVYKEDAQGCHNEAYSEMTTFHGEAEITLPPGTGKRLVKGIRAVMRAFSTIDFGGDRGVETDLFYENEVRPDIPSENLVLEEGVNHAFLTFEYCALFPATDTFVQCPSVTWVLYVQFIGIRPTDEQLDLPSHLSLNAYGQIDRTTPFPAVDEAVAPLARTVTGMAYIEFIHHPSLDGTGNRLDDRGTAFAPEIGVVETMCASNDFTVAGPFTAKIQVTGASDKVSFYAARLSVLQTVVCHSPKDQEKVKSEQIVRFAEHGETDSEQPLWKGTEAKDDVDRNWSLEMSGRFPHSSQIRPSTLPGISTPVSVVHYLVYDLFFTVIGRDGYGKPYDGPGKMQRFRRRSRVVIPHCALTSGRDSLPTYEDLTSQTILSTYRDEVCPSCHRLASQVICRTCEGRVIPHTKLEAGTGPDDPCPDCRDKKLKPKPATDHYSQGHCACTEWCKKYRNPDQNDVREFTEQVTDVEEKKDRTFASKIQDEWDSTMPNGKRN
ncbi:hypothetical protein BD324DRAFT_679783 [Kockovaella imperatae]|uniref:Arrestin-like N-terminal domain-containing protein n=1 Tax=Kockovaella imperatae TaxID=4999 RepID=A0A1Y1UMN0_9TREE|nr:hypothetical protein BD324DRAFT_679783 [Kockovaella imperatae]ORX39308.1 hypothetical protein BD324DRAFT_679783 [Kockovaella imperatae]